MAFVVKSGLKHEPIFIENDKGEQIQIGTAIYDLNDVRVQAGLVGLKDDMKALMNKYLPVFEALQADTAEDEDGWPLNLRTIADTSIQCYDEMAARVDATFGPDFCATACGASKNPNLVWEIVAMVIGDYNADTQKEMGKWTGDKKRNAGARGSVVK